jgi:hypothetical protein
MMAREGVTVFQRPARFAFAVLVAATCFTVAVHSSRAQTPPNLLPNPGFEVPADNSNQQPLGWVAFFPVQGAVYEYHTGTPHTLSSYVSTDIFGDAPTCPDHDAGTWLTAVAISIDVSKTYQLSLWARSDNFANGGTADPLVLIEYDDIGGTKIGNYGLKAFNFAQLGDWEPYSALIGPTGDLVPPPGTAKIKVGFGANNSVPPTACVNGTSYSRVSFDDVSLAQTGPLSLGGVDEQPDFASLSNAAATNGTPSPFVVSIGVAGSALAIMAAAGVLAQFRRHR